MKYFLHEQYQKPDLMPLIRLVSDTLMLVNLVDYSISMRVWQEAFDTAVSTYFFYFVLINENTFEDKARSSDRSA